MNPAIVEVLKRVDGPDGVMVLARDERGGRAAIYLDPHTAMSLADQITALAETWTLPPVIA